MYGFCSGSVLNEESRLEIREMKMACLIRQTPFLVQCDLKPRSELISYSSTTICLKLSTEDE